MTKRQKHAASLHTSISSLRLFPAEEVPRTAQNGLSPLSKSSFSPEAYTKPFCDFITNNPTVFHAISNISSKLESHGYSELSERDLWTSKLKKGGKYFCTRNGSALIAFVIGENYNAGNSVGIVAGHFDGLTARLKPIPKLQTKAGFVQLGIAPYAGALNNTW